MNKFIKNIDWQTLKLQKLALLKIIPKDKYREEIFGILNLLDALQDYAVDELGIDEKIIFNLEDA